MVLSNGSSTIVIAKFCPDLNAVQCTKSKPLKPFDQLMFVLPPQSAYLLPKSYGKLMTDIASPLLSYYLIDFELDTRGAPFYGSAVPKLPIFDVDDVKSVLKSARLSAQDKQRNTVGKLVELNAGSDQEST